MEQPLFRQKSMERISSPEELHDYMRVTSPRLWMILSAIVILLAGFLVYASTVHMENIMPIQVIVVDRVDSEDQAAPEAKQPTYAYGFLPISEKNIVEVGMTVRINGQTGRVTAYGTVYDEDQVMIDIEMDQNSVPMPAGKYEAELILESATPISFLWN